MLKLGFFYRAKHLTIAIQSFFPEECFLNLISQLIDQGFFAIHFFPQYVQLSKWSGVVVNCLICTGWSSFLVLIQMCKVITHCLKKRKGKKPCKHSKIISGGEYIGIKEFSILSQIFFPLRKQTGSVKKVRKSCSICKRFCSCQC